MMKLTTSKKRHLAKLHSMKKLLLVCAGLLGLCTLGQTSARAGGYGYDDGDYGYRPARPVYQERYYNDDDDGYRCHPRPRRRVVVREYYTSGYYNDCGPRYRQYRRPRSRVNIVLPLPPLPF